MLRFVRQSLNALLLFTFVFASAARGFAVEPEHWVGTWAASPVAAKQSSGRTPGAGAGVKIREFVHVSLGGTRVRVTLTNELGVEPLTITSAAIGLRNGNDAPTVTAALSFSGRASVTIPPGAVAVSDAATLKLPAMSDLAIMVDVPDQAMTLATVHGFANATNYILAAAAAPVTAASAPAAPPQPTPIGSWMFLKSVDVVAAANASAVVTLGDSITDGSKSTRDANLRWPDLLAARLAADKKAAPIGVLNEGIGGNRLLHDVTGPSALARFDRDVLSHSGVKYLIVLEAINDIGHAYDPVKPYDVITAEDLIFALNQIIDRAHAHGIKVFGATLTPYVGAKYASPEGEKVRLAENEFIRHSGRFDGVIDFEKAAMDPATQQFTAATDSGDHLHPTDAGMRAMAGAVDLTLFEK